MDKVAAHLVAAGSLIDEDPETALAHARAARDRASRVAVVREAVGVAASHAGDYAEAARELRAYRRMSGDHGYRAVLADCERALGRPEVALRLVAEALTEEPDQEETAELRLVEAGARRDLGEDAAARLVLEAALGGLDPEALADSVEFTDLDDLIDDDEDDDLEAETEGADQDQTLSGGDAAPEETDAAIDPEDAELDDAEALEAAIEAEFERSDDEEPGAEESAADAGAFPTGGRSFQDEVEAEVAELLGETGDDADSGAGSTDS
ncbi:hypothetical protein JKP75_08640 [Blastococcus sp. TML/M2B]|uniref:tetratricopeptide repeat protein n=1 Tax=Blastococcus sp. TML/M2B TaxID=2798727 RepID=UPI00190B7295|nr:hypothetical protein [Blastococcus sp. TML/M2B]MBN1092619.1 hypothetical protein [Blastococcus sp. TML/M2B]